MSLIKNASPEVILLGATDKSIKALKPENQPIPQHLPLCFIFAKKGTSKKVLCGGAMGTLLYGAETFDKNSPYYTHQTRYLSGFIGNGNTCAVKRLIPEDAGVRASACLYVDMVPAQVPNYKRNSMGDFIMDPVTNAYAVDETTPEIAGVKIKFIRENHTTETSLGLLTTKAGTMTEDGVTSTMYPILEFQAKEKGKAYNNLGFSISSIFGSEVDSKIITATKGLSYKFALHTRDNENATAALFRNLYGEPSTLISLKDKAINPNTEARFDLEQVFNTMFFNEKDELKPLSYFDYEGIHVYRNNIEYVSGAILANEKQYVDYDAKTWADGSLASTMSWFDFSTDDATKIMEEKYAINLFTLRSSKNIKYFTAIAADNVSTLTGTQREVSVSSNTPIFMSGGADGSLTDEMFELLVKKELAKYLDPDSDVIDTANNVESIMYDSGFSLNLKKEMTNFIAVRKDTNLVLSTHVASLGERVLPLSDERAIGVALRTRLNLAPESEYYGTGVARAIVQVGAGKLRDGSTADYIPYTYDLGMKASRMMGAGTGKWKREYLFDKAPGNIVTELTECHPEFIPAGLKPTLWNDGLVWAQPYDRTQFHYPALQTVYSNDTSVLNSFFTVQALGTLNKIGADAWRNFSGATSLTNGEFIDAVTAYVTARLKDLFADMIVVVPEVTITEEDEVRGYSWRLVNKLYANNMKTKMIYTTEAYNMSELNA